VVAATCAATLKPTGPRPVVAASLPASKPMSHDRWDGPTIGKPAVERLVRQTCTAT
jgi:hypothetical protein